jgi:hypothetical protein
MFCAGKQQLLRLFGASSDAPDKSDQKQMDVSEVELKAEEEWVQNKFAELDIQHIINMHQTDKWTDVPQDVEVRIAKH